MNADQLAALLGLGPTGIAAIALWWAYRKDTECGTLKTACDTRIEAMQGEMNRRMDQVADLARAQAVGATEVKNSLDAIRDAIRVGTQRS